MGISVGVASETLPLGYDSAPETIPSSEASIFWWKSRGRVGQNTGANSVLGETTNYGIEENKPIRVKLNCDEGTLEFWTSRRAGREFAEDDFVVVARLTGITGAVKPFVYFDYESKGTYLFHSKDP